MASIPSVQVDRVPESVEDFLAVRDDVASTPQGGAAMMVLALIVYAQDEALGRQCLTVAVDRELLQQGDEGYKGWQVRRRDMDLIRTQVGRRPFVPRSYVQGTSPENGYRLPEPPYRFDFVDNPHAGEMESGRFKLFITCSGADSPRPILVQKNNRGVWKAFEWSSLLVGIRKPVEEQDDDL